MNEMGVLVKHRTQPYLCVIEKGQAEGGRVYYSGYCLDVSANVVAKASREEVIESLRQGMALTLLRLAERGMPAPRAKTQAKDVVKEAPDDELVWLEPLEVNPVSLELERVLKEKGLKQSDVARLLGVSRTAVNRLVDPFYWGQSLSSLRKLAEVTGAKLEIKLSL